MNKVCSSDNKPLLQFESTRESTGSVDHICKICETKFLDNDTHSSKDCLQIQILNIDSKLNFELS